MYCVISEKSDFWARLRASWPNFIEFLAQNNQKEQFFHIQLEEMMSEVCKAQTNNLKLYCVCVWSAKSIFRGMFRKQKCSLGSYLIVGKEESEKNHFAKFLEFFENFSEILLLNFGFTEWAELALPILTFSKCILPKKCFDKIYSWKLILKCMVSHLTSIWLSRIWSLHCPTVGHKQHLR